MVKCSFALQFLFVVVVIIHFPNFSHSIVYESFNGYQVKELNSIKTERFNLEAQPWNVVLSNSTSRVTLCGNFLLLAGYGVLESDGYLERSYTSLPNHNVIYVKIQFFFLDEWYTNDKFEIQFDGIKDPVSNVVFKSSAFNSSICGSFYNDLTEVTMVSRVLHESSNLTLKIVSNIKRDPTIASFGIRDIFLIFAKTTQTIEPDGCFYIQNNQAMPGGSSECKCPTGSYSDPLQSLCLSCNEGCSYCFGPSAGECYECKPGYSFVDTECIKCHSSCDTCSGPNEDQCVTCNNGLWLHWNNTCLSTCDSSPTAQEEIDDFKVCHTPCSSSEFMLWNQTCVSSCAFPLVQKIVRNDNLCQKPCKEGEFIYPNGSCIRSCSPFFVKKIIENVTICDYPCDFNGNEFLLFDGSCVSTCSYPLRQRIEKNFRFCDEAIDNADEEKIKQVNKVISTTGDIASIGIIMTNLASSASSSSFSIASLAKMLRYIRYMSIIYPENVEILLLNQNSSSISMNFGPEIPQDIEAEFPRYPLPAKFAYYNLHSSFIVNFWDTITTLEIILAIIIFSSIMIVIATRCKKKYINLLFSRIQGITKWNLFLIIFCNNYDGIAFFSSLEIRTISYFDCWRPILSFLLCIAFNLVAISILGLTFYVLIDLRNRKKKSIMPFNSEEPSTYPVKFNALLILIRSFKEDSFLHQAFLLFFLIRIYLFDIIIGYLFEYPLAQALLIAIMSSVMLIYLISKRPFKEKSEQIEFLTNEVILFIVNINVLILAILDYTGTEASDTRNSFGEMIIICNVAFNILGLIFVSFHIASALVKGYRIIKRSKGKLNWLKIIVLIFEKDGMMIEDEESHKSPCSIGFRDESIRAQGKRNSDDENDRNKSLKEGGSKIQLTLISNKPLRNAISLQEGEENYELAKFSSRNSVLSSHRLSKLNKILQSRGSELRTDLGKEGELIFINLNDEGSKLSSDLMPQSSVASNLNKDLDFAALIELNQLMVFKQSIVIKEELQVKKSNGISSPMSLNSSNEENGPPKALANLERREILRENQNNTLKKGEDDAQNISIIFQDCQELGN